MKITVWSVLSGKVSGHLVMTVPETHSVHKVLDTYCNYKGVPGSDGYVMRSRDNLVLNPSKTLGQAKVQDGDTLTLGLLDDEQQTFAFGSWWMVSLASFTIGIIGLIMACWIYLQPLHPIQKYGVVVDAGSSHSEVFLFTWDGEMPLGTADVDLFNRCLIIGGITNFATHIEDLGEYFSLCMNETASLIPSHFHQETPLYVGATAGMRMLKDFDQEGADGILMSVREFLGTNTAFQVEQSNVGILPSFEEGASGWIAVNYLLHKFKQVNASTVDTLDLGGASVQVTSEINKHNHWNSSDVTLFNHTHTIHSQSFLCYGVHEASHRYHYLLVNENITDVNKESPSTVDPCLAEGAIRKLPISDILGPCTLTKSNTAPDLSGIINVNIVKLQKIFKAFMKVDVSDKQISAATTTVKPTVGQETSSLVFRGSSDVKKCEERVRHLFNFQLCNSTFVFGDCMNAHFVPAINKTVIAFSGIFHHLNPLLRLEPQPTFDQFKKVVFDVCSLNADLLFASYPELDKELVEDLCFDSMYVYSLLTAGLGITNTTWPDIRFTSEVNQNEVVWPHGFMLNRTTSFPSSPPPSPTLSISHFCFLVLLFLAFVLSGFLFLHHSLSLRNHSASYQRCDKHDA